MALAEIAGLPRVFNPGRETHRWVTYLAALKGAYKVPVRTPSPAVALHYTPCWLQLTAAADSVYITCVSMAMQSFDHWGAS